MIRYMLNGAADPLPFSGLLPHCQPNPNLLSCDLVSPYKPAAILLRPCMKKNVNIGHVVGGLIRVW